MYVRARAFAKSVCFGGFFCFFFGVHFKFGKITTVARSTRHVTQPESFCPCLFFFFVCFFLGGGGVWVNLPGRKKKKKKVFDSLFVLLAVRS